MAVLSAGVLVKLVEEMGHVGKKAKPAAVLLQIRSIIPLLGAEEDNLWPNQGFYLKVSDSSHAMYVSLPHDQDELILSNKLQLGQYIYVQKLENTYPIPVLKGVTPLPGRHPCIGTPEDIVITGTNLKKEPQCKTFDLGCIINEEKNIPKKKNYRSLSASRPRPIEQNKGRIALNSHVSKSSSSSKPMRRSWNEVETTKIKEISESSVQIKHEIIPVLRPRPRSACGSPIHSARYDNSDDNPSSRTRRTDIGLATRSVKSPNMSRRISKPGKNCETFKLPTVFSSIKDKEWTESKISWDSLPPNLAKLGKEVLAHRDVALLAAVEALQEASAAERLVRCLSTHSGFQSAKEDNLQPSVDKFLDLQHELAHTRLIVQSLTQISPLRTTKADTKGTNSIKEVLDIAFERKKHATSWIKAAVTSDLSPFSAPSEHSTTSSVKATDTVKKSSTTLSHGSTPRNTSCIVRTQRKGGEVHVGLAAEKDSLQDWVKGSALCAAADLGSSLQDECRRWFLAYIENYLDGVETETIPVEPDSEIAAGMMYQFKRVNDWLDGIVSKEANTPKNGLKDGSALEESELEACGRVKNKIYGVLLNHVERTALALQHMNATPQA